MIAFPDKLGFPSWQPQEAGSAMVSTHELVHFTRSRGAWSAGSQLQGSYKNASQVDLGSQLFGYDPTEPYGSEASQIATDTIVAAFARDTLAEQKFKSLTRQWHDECLLSSSITEICTNLAYQQIIGMGAEALPFIFRELRREPDHWFWALQAITCENPGARRGGRRLGGNGDCLA